MPRLPGVYAYLLIRIHPNRSSVFARGSLDTVWMNTNLKIKKFIVKMKKITHLFGIKLMQFSKLTLLTNSTDLFYKFTLIRPEVTS